MTRINETEKVCPVCGAMVRTVTLLSTYSSGCDLDTRPGGLARNAFYINECKKCHYVFENMDEYDDKYADIVNSADYQKIFSLDNGFSEDARCYSALAFLQKKSGADLGIVGFQYLKAAWKEDDVSENLIDTKDSLKAANNAVYFRKLAIECYEKTDDLNEKFILLDLYRRTNQFDRADDFLKKMSIPADIDAGLSRIFSNIIKIESCLIQKKDNKAHSLSIEE